MRLVATCSRGLEPFLKGELQALGMEDLEEETGAIGFVGTWEDCWRANLCLRTANRVLVKMAMWRARSDLDLYEGGKALILDGVPGKDGYAGRSHWKHLDLRVERSFIPVEWFSPDHSLALNASLRDAPVTDGRWAVLRLKDGIVDGQREHFGRRSSIDRSRPDRGVRLRWERDHVSLLIDSSGVALDRRGYRSAGGVAPVRETLAAACVLASEWDGRGPVVDPMCGSGTLIIEAALFASRQAPGLVCPRRWDFERFPGHDRSAFRSLAGHLDAQVIRAPMLYGIDSNPKVVELARENLERAGFEDARVRRRDGLQQPAPRGQGLLLVNPPYGERLEEGEDSWRQLGDMLKTHYGGWKAVVLAGGDSRGKHIGLKPTRRIPVRNGPLDARILVFDLWQGHRDS